MDSNFTFTNLAATKMFKAAGLAVRYVKLKMKDERLKITGTFAICCMVILFFVKKKVVKSKMIPTGRILQFPNLPVPSII